MLSPRPAASIVRLSWLSRLTSTSEFPDSSRGGMSQSRRHRNRSRSKPLAVSTRKTKPKRGSRSVGGEPRRAKEAMSPQDFLVHSRQSKDGRGDLLTLPRQLAGWEWLSFFVHRLAPGQSRNVGSENEEVAIILLGGKCVADWGEGQHRIGDRAHVFDGLPYAIYLPAASRAQLRAETACELAECRVP